jgi:hypothetical protein
MAMPSDAAPSSPDGLLAVVENLAHYHGEHEKYYATAPLDSALRLQRISRGLKALAERWREAEPQARPLPSPFAGATDLNDERAIESLGILFMEGEGEPVELAAVKAELRAFADSHRSMGRWLSGAMDAGWAMAQRLLDYPELAELLAERHRIITTDWQTASMSTVMGHAVDRAVDILDRIDFTPAAVREDLATGRHDSRLLFSACELLDHAADLAAVSATLTHENDRRWRLFHDRVQQLNRPPAGS